MIVFIHSFRGISKQTLIANSHFSSSHVVVSFRMTSLASVIESNEYLELTPTNRVRCTVTGHEMPLKVDVVLAYLQSKKFHAAVEWYVCPISFSQHPHL